MTPERHSTPPLNPDESAATVQLLVSDPGNKSAISDMLDEEFVVETSETVTDADLYLIEDHLFPEYRAALRKRMEQEDPVFCPIVLIRRERTNLRQPGGGPSPGDRAAPYDEVVDAPIDPQLLIRRLNSLLVRRHQSQELMEQVSTLENREQRLRRFEHGIEATGNGIVMTDTGGTIEYVNPAFEAISGYSTDALLGESPQLLLPGGSGEFFDTEFRDTLAEHGDWEGDVIIDRKDSHRRVVNAKATALQQTERGTGGFVLVLSDITERIGRERQLEDREEQLDLLRQIMTRYLRHNLRNDLSVILGNAELLKEDETLSAEHIAFAETIIDTANDLMEKSDTARTYSQLLDHKTELSSFDLSRIVTAAVETLRESYSDVTFDIDVPDTCEIRAREGTQRAIEELIDNAARYNDAMDPLVRVQVRDRDGARVVIEDNGPGISDQELDSLQRGTETQLSHSQGIGLWLSKWLIESIEGHLSIETTDPGTRVTVELPAPESVGSESVEVTTLKERERRLQTITDRMTDATLTVDADWEITRLDERAEEILDVTWDTVVGKSFWDVFPNLRESPFETAVQDAMQSRSTTSVEEYFPQLDAWLMVDVYPEFDGGLSYYFRDVTERVQRKTTLEETNERLETMIGLSPEPIIGIDASGAVFLWNEAAEDVFGHAAADVIGEGIQSLDLFETGEKYERFEERFGRVLAGETIRGLEMTRQRKDGSSVDLSVSATPLNQAPGDGTGMLAIAQDITQLKERERNLLERVKELSAIHDATTLFQTADAPLKELLSKFVESIPQSFQYTDVAEARLRYDGTEVSTADFESWEHVLTEYADLDDGAQIELAVGYRSDPKIDIEDPFLAEEEELLATLLTVVKNRVQRRTHLKSLERTEELLTNAERLGDVGAWEIDIETREVFWTEGTRRIHEVSEAFKPTFEAAIDFFHPEDRDRVTDVIKACAESGDSFALEARIQTADDNERWVQIEGERAKTEGDSSRVDGYIRDITERKERNRRYEAIFNQTYQFTGLIEPNGTIIEANDRVLEFGDITRADVLGKKLWNAYWFEISEETQLQTKADVQRAAAGEFVRRELEIQGSEGTTVIDFSIRPITDEDGTVTLLVPEGRDISQRKQRDRELSDLKRRYQTMIEAAPDAIFVADAETGEIIEVNEAAERLLGESSDDIIGWHQSDLHPSEKFEQYRQSFEEYVEVNGTTRTLPDGSQMFIEKSDGEQVPVEISVDTVSVPGETVMFGIFRDISERVEREAEIQNEHAKFKAVFENSFDAMVLADDEGRYIEANESAIEMFGVSEEELLGRSIAEFAPADFDFAEAWTQFQQSDAERGTFPLVRGDGEKRIVEFAATPNIVPGQHLSILRDKTEAKRQEHKLEQIINRVTDAIVEVDADWRFTLVNEQAEDLYDMSEDDLLGQSLWNVFENAEGTRFEEEYRDVMQSRDPTSFVEYYSQLDGWFDIKAYPKDDGGIAFYFVDVTEQFERQRDLE
ncbi:PAS domain S-box protein [Halodesulfurarchaeum sp.]|uniref:PAS domain S-box protein n=1 Tax=Halodesulfurarchaeum sp. TaxID=1980530 RepID=UPI002FC32AE8